MFVNCKLVPRCVQTAFLKDCLFLGNDCGSHIKQVSCVIAQLLYHSTCFFSTQRNHRLIIPTLRLSPIVRSQCWKRLDNASKVK